MRKFITVFGLALLATSTAHAYRLSAWVTPWSPEALPSIEMNAGNLDESNPVWYSLAANGTISPNWNAENPTWIAAMTGTAIVPTIQNFSNGRFDSALVAALIGTAHARQAHIDAIVALVLAKGLDGIDLDYESLQPDLREPFTLFIEALASELRAAGRTLSVAVHPKTSDSQNWKGPGAQDWPRIGAAADSIKVMAYDYHWSTSGPGPIAPLDWIESVTRYALSTMPAEKVMIALPWYGYDWGTAGGKGITWSEATALANSTGSVIERDANGEPTFRYGSNTVFYQDGESYRRKVEHLTTRFPSLGGFAHWRAGAEDPATWSVIRDLRASGGAGASQPKGSFTIAGGNRIEATGGQPASETFSIVAIDGFSSAVQARMELIDLLPGSAVFPAGTLQAGESATLTVTPAADAAAGTYRVKIIFEAETNRIEHIVSIEVAKIEVTTGSRGRAVRR
ncbi:MAG TPA: glycosyl hydrolase family 18 protein [Thermoanaerobaculia bacterium]|nr:glycosyl hydrolase family 18 protein [Thermoanaerobaculia bacterium]